jgi:hypothetical protein
MKLTKPQKIATLAIVVPAILAGLAIYVNIITSPGHIADFQISVDPMGGSVPKGGNTQMIITVKSINNYEYEVSLSPSGNPTGMIVNPVPPSNKPTPAYTSNVFITVTSIVEEGDYPIVIKGTGADGKEHSCTYTLTVKPLKTLTVSIAPAGPISLDIGQSQMFTATYSGGSGSIHYQWYLDGSAVSGATSSTYSFDGSAGTYTVTCKVTDSASVPVISDSSNAVSVTVNSAKVAPTAVVSPGSWTMDVGQSKTFSATASGGSGTYTSYQWYVGGVAQSGATTSTFSYNAVSVGSSPITVTVTDSLGVTSVQSSAASIAVGASPTVTIAPIGSLIMIAGQSQAFAATANGGSGVIHYQWYLDGSAIGSDSSSYSYTASGASHSVTCKVTDSASNPVTSAASNAVTITVTTVTISFPIGGSSVSQLLTAQGTTQNIPSGQVIWAVVYVPSIALYYPMPIAAVVQQTSGSWQTQVTVGGPNDTGLQFDIIMVVANQAGQASLVAYNQDAERNHPGNYPGIPQLPAGLVECSKVTVTRLPWTT